MDEPTCSVNNEECRPGSLCRGMCRTHYMRWWRTGSTELPDRTVARRDFIRSRLPTGVPGQCWLWTGRTNKDGYGVLHARGAESSLAHRLAYEILVGLIPEGMTIDHMCHRTESCAGGKTCPHRRCCNPAHLKVATNGANALRGHSPSGANSRKTYCDHGHEFTEANTYWHKGRRQCRTCRRDQDRKRPSGSVRQRRAREQAGLSL